MILTTSIDIPFLITTLRQHLGLSNSQFAKYLGMAFQIVNRSGSCRLLPY
ncbi:hypothetical protein [Okeania sp. SIO1I7]|nr:hypothetical protein [Okeania sp. SIO1I7]NET25873.1 hypothetical protein [Okeania sp. SIO1I7]